MADTQAPAAQAAVETVAQNAPETEKQAPAKPDANEAFARKERQIRRMQKELETEKAQWKAKMQEYETNYIPKSKLTEDPLSTLAEQGIDYNKLTEMLLNQPNQNDPTVKALRAEIKKIQDQQNAAMKAQEEAVQKQYEQALSQIRNEVKLTVSSSPEFETIKEKGMEEAVVSLIEETFNKDGYLMDIEEAAKQVEDYLVEEGLSFAKLKKVQAKLTPVPQEAPASAPKAKQTSPITTITNRMTQEAPKRSTDKERRERAIAAFMGKLNNQ